MKRRLVLLLAWRDIVANHHALLVEFAAARHWVSSSSGSAGNRMPRAASANRQRATYGTAPLTSRPGCWPNRVGRASAAASGAMVPAATWWASARRRARHRRVGLEPGAQPVISIAHGRTSSRPGPAAQAAAAIGAARSGRSRPPRPRQSRPGRRRARRARADSPPGRRHAAHQPQGRRHSRPAFRFACAGQIAISLVIGIRSAISMMPRFTPAARPRRSMTARKVIGHLGDRQCSDWPTPRSRRGTTSPPGLDQQDRRACGGPAAARARLGSEQADEARGSRQISIRVLSPDLSPRPREGRIDRQNRQPPPCLGEPEPQRLDEARLADAGRPGQPDAQALAGAGDGNRRAAIR